MNLSAGQQWRCRHREQTCGHSVGRGGSRRIERVTLNIYITTCKIDSQFVDDAGSSNPDALLWQPRGLGWDGRREGVSREREAIADSCWCVAETNTL